MQPLSGLEAGLAGRSDADDLVSELRQALGQILDQGGLVFDDHQTPGRAVFRGQGQQLDRRRLPRHVSRLNHVGGIPEQASFHVRTSIFSSTCSESAGQGYPKRVTSRVPVRSYEVSGSRNARLRSLPVVVIGSSSRNSTIRGALYAVSRSRQKSMISAALGRDARPSLSTTNAFTASPR